jgi:hypothetical protein
VEKIGPGEEARLRFLGYSTKKVVDREASEAADLRRFLTSYVDKRSTGYSWSNDRVHMSMTSWPMGTPGASSYVMLAADVG